MGDNKMEIIIFIFKVVAYNSLAWIFIYIVLRRLSVRKLVADLTRPNTLSISKGYLRVCEDNESSIRLFSMELYKNIKREANPYMIGHISEDYCYKIVYKTLQKELKKRRIN